MKIVYLLPPSEGKNVGGNPGGEITSFCFEKPLHIAKNATPKDLKCSGKRYEEGIELNRMLCRRSPSIPLIGGGGELQSEQGECVPAISRYSGVMYNAIDYAAMSTSGQKYFENNFLILSGMYGLVKPTDMIGNYKLPIETRGLYAFWGSKITEALNNLGVDIIVDFLPGSYAKMIQWKDISAKIVRVNFYSPHPQPLSQSERGENQKLKKMTHGVKKVKGEYIKKICESGFTDLPDVSDGKQFSVDVISSL